MGTLAIVLGALLVFGVFADMVNTLITTTQSSWPYWMTQILFRKSWSVVKILGARIPNPRGRERLYAVSGPVSMLAMLAGWVIQQIIGFGLIWWGIGGVSGLDSFLDALYFSGVVYFTVGFGEVVPVDEIPRFGALIEAFAGVLTTALVIGYLPAPLLGIQRTGAEATHTRRRQRGSHHADEPRHLTITRC